MTEAKDGGAAERFTPWFLAATDEPVREGRYQVRFCIGWRSVLCEWRKGRWWLPMGGLDGSPAPIRLDRWPGFHWRGLIERT